MVATFGLFRYVQSKRKLQVMQQNNVVKRAFSRPAQNPVKEKVHGSSARQEGALFPVSLICQQHNRTSPEPVTKREVARTCGNAENQFSFAHPL
jgi:hypothetical protein